MRHHYIRSKMAIINKTNNSRCLEPFRETVSLIRWWQECKPYSHQEIHSPVLTVEGFSPGDSENCIFRYLNTIIHMAKWFHWHITRNLFPNNHRLGIKLHIHHLVNKEMVVFAHRWLYLVLRASFLYMSQLEWTTKQTMEMARDTKDYSQMNLMLTKF